MFTTWNQVICKFTNGWRNVQIQNSGGISNHEGIIYNFKIKMFYLNKVTTTCCIWKYFNYYIMITLLPSKVKIMRQMFKLKKLFCLGKYSCIMCRVTMCHAYQMCHVSITTGVVVSYCRKLIGLLVLARIQMSLVYPPDRFPLSQSAALSVNSASFWSEAMFTPTESCNGRETSRDHLENVGVDGMIIL
jgi:hypothetical protein